MQGLSVEKLLRAALYYSELRFPDRPRGWGLFSVQDPASECQPISVPTSKPGGSRYGVSVKIEHLAPVTLKFKNSVVGSHGIMTWLVDFGRSHIL